MGDGGKDTSPMRENLAPGAPVLAQNKHLMLQKEP
jgi:hypothetical protein